MSKTESEIDQDIESLVGTMAISGLTLSDEDIEDCRAILKGEVDGEAAVSELLKYFRAIAKDEN